MVTELRTRGAADVAVPLEDVDVLDADLIETLRALEARPAAPKTAIWLEPQDWATRLIASVVPGRNAISVSERAPTKGGTVRRASS